MNARRPSLDIAIAGGGMVGAACALALAKRGFAVALLEAREPATWNAADPEDLRVIALAPSSARLLDELGAWRSIEGARVSPYSHMRVWDGESGAELTFDAAREGRAQLGWIVENKLLARTLWDALEGAGVRCVCPAHVASFSQREDRVTLELGDGEMLSAALLVIADGASSALRDQAGIAVRGRDYHQRAVVAHVATERAHDATAWQRFTDEGPIALLPLADGRCSIVWSLPEARAREVLALDDVAFCEAAGIASDFRLGRITASTPRASFPLRLQIAERFAAGRCVLIGDAAHAVHPLAGQGANLGLRDVAELAAVLGEARDAGRDFTAPHVLARYARRRRSAGALDARTFDAIERMFAWQSPAWAALRGFGMRAVDVIEPLKRRLSAHAAGLTRQETIMRKTFLALLLLSGFASFAHAAMRTQTIDYSVDGKSMQGVLVWDDAVKAPRPGLLMIPDWVGINAVNIDFAKSIAGKDYVIFMGDMYGKDLRPKDNKEAQAATKPLYADRPMLRKRVAAAFAELKALAAKHAAPIDASKLAAIGFCFGGTSVLDLARSGSDVAAVVSFHGGLGTDDPALAKHIKARVLAMNGADDRGTMPDAPAFMQEMQQSPAPWQFVAFGGAVHCFAEPQAHSPPGCVYDPPVAKRAFALMHAWLDEAFAGKP